MGTISLEDARQDVLEEALKENPTGLALDLGCGQRPVPGCTGVDPNFKQDGILNIDLFKFPWPLDDNSVCFVNASHFIEHIPEWDPFFEELYRVCAKDAHLILYTPYYSSLRATMDPDHKQMISEERYLYLDRTWREREKIDHYSAGVDFRMEYQPWYWWHDDYADKSEEAKWWAKKRYLNVVLDIVVWLKAIKET